jgi:hypothetical protein
MRKQPKHDLDFATSSDSMLRTLRLAEMYQDWSLYGALLRYFKAAGARLMRVDAGVYAITKPEDR